MPDDPPGATGRLRTDAVRESPASPYDTWREASAAHPGAVQLGVGFPFIGSFPTEELAAATDEVLREEPEALQYGGGDAAGKFSEAIVDHVGHREPEVSPEEVLVTDGATRGIHAVCGVFLEPGRAVFTEELTFPGSLTVFRNHGSEVVSCPLDRQGLDVGWLEGELDRRERAGEGLPTLLYSTPTFQNPTGTTLPRSTPSACSSLPPTTTSRSSRTTPTAPCATTAKTSCRSRRSTASARAPTG